MSLFLDAGFCARLGHRKAEHESCLVIVPDPRQAAAHGALLAVADAVPGTPQPAEAARDALHALGESYYAAPEHWALRHALHESVLAAHHAVRGGGGERGRAVSLSALVLRGRRYALAHAGDTRVWLWRDAQWRLLTRDHITPRARRAPEVYNACGLGETPQIELAFGELADGDVFVLATRGVHSSLDSPAMVSALLPDVSARAVAERLVEQAQAAAGSGHSEDLGVCVARVEQLPPRTESDAQEETVSLPILPPPVPGSVIDGFHIEALVHTSRRHRLYRALDTESGQTVMLRFPNPKFRREPAFPERFLREEWVSRRVAHAHLVSVLPLRTGRRTALYSVLAYHPGENLHQRLRRKRRLTVKETLLIGRQLLEALAALHRQGVIHRDIRPKNMIFDKKTRSLRLLGLGASYDTDRLEEDKDEAGGVPSGAHAYTAPELQDGGTPDARSDVYAAGVTLYRLLTGKYPYGKTRVRPPRRGGDGSAGFVPPSRYRDDVPPFLEEALTRACALDPAQRFPSAEAFAAALEEDVVESLVVRPAAGKAATAATAARRPGAAAVWMLAGVLLAGLLFYLTTLLK